MSTEALGKSSWAARALLLVVALGLFQSGFTGLEWDAIKTRARQSQQSVVALVEAEQGPLALARFAFMTNSDERMFAEYARLVLEGVADLDYISAKQYADVELPNHPPPWRPYRDVRVEYPPIAMIGVTVPGLFSLNSWGYRFFLGLMNIGLLWLVVGLSKPLLTTSVGRASRDWRILAMTLAIGVIIVTRIDLLATGFLVAAGLALHRAHWLRGGVLTGLGILTKIFPGLWLGVYGVILLRRRRFSALARFVGATLLTVGSITLVMWLLTGDGYFDTFAYHSQRGTQIESSWASLLLPVQLIADIGLRLELSFGSSNLVTPVDAIVAAGWPLVFVLLTAPSLLAVWKRRPNADATTVMTAVLLAFILANKVFSPQFLLWVFPFVLFQGGTRGKRVAVVFVLACVLSQVIYPRGYDALKAFHPLLVSILVLRNLLVGWLWLEFSRRCWRPRDGGVSTAQATAN